MELETPWMYVKNVGTVCFSFYIPFIYITMTDIISIVLYGPVSIQSMRH